MSFESLKLHDSLLHSIEKLGHTIATPIQDKAIPLVLQGADVIAAAQTGSGKTAAFVLPILQRFANLASADSPERSLILVPTRELADQVGNAIRAYSELMPRAPRILIVFGGVDIDLQIEKARAGVDIIVATPGRLIDLVDRQVIDLSDINLLVLDEADRLLALGFADELNAIFKHLPAERQNLLFSATFPPAVVEISDTLLNNPEKIQLEFESKPGENILQRAIEIERGDRTALLRHLLKVENWSRVLVFVATKRRAANITAKLSKHGIRATVLHGDLKQDRRTRALENFKAGKTQVLMATDLAARGIDIVNLPCVVNYDLPRSPSDYVHRIGRTGRAGESGVAISFVSIEDHQHFQLIEKRHKLSIERERIEGFTPAAWDPDSIPSPSAPIKGKRKSKKDKSREAAERKSRSRASEKQESPGEENDSPVLEKPQSSAIKNPRSTEIPPQEPEKAAPEPKSTPKEIVPEKAVEVSVEKPQPVESVSSPIQEPKTTRPPIQKKETKDPVDEPSSKITVSDPWAQALKKIREKD